VSIIDGKRVETLRKQRGWSQHELARQAGITAPVISRMERELQTDFDLSAVVGIARALGVPVDLLLTADIAADSEAIPELQRAFYLAEHQPDKIQRHIALIVEAYVTGLLDFTK
jgi:transcriptional regulator with XRE-family HTH domain